jgi:hypothetical protein
MDPAVPTVARRSREPVERVWLRLRRAVPTVLKTEFSPSFVHARTAQRSLAEVLRGLERRSSGPARTISSLVDE